MQSASSSEDTRERSVQSWDREVVSLKKSPSESERVDLLKKLESLCLGEGMSLIKMPATWTRAFLEKPSKERTRTLTECVEQSKYADMHRASEPFAAIVVGEQKRGMQKDQELCMLIGGGTGANRSEIERIVNASENSATMFSELSSASKEANITSRAARSHLAVKIAEACCGVAKSEEASSLSIVGSNTICDSCHTQCSTIGETSLEITNRCLSGNNTWGNVLVIGNVDTHGVDVVTSTDRNALQGAFPNMTYYSHESQSKEENRETEEIQKLEETQKTQQINIHDKMVANAILATENSQNKRFARWHLSGSCVQWEDENVINMHRFQDDNQIKGMDVVAHYNIIAMAISNPDPENHELRIAMQKNLDAEIYVHPNDDMLRLMTQAEGGLSVDFASCWAAQTSTPQGPRMRLSPKHMATLKSFIRTKHQDAIDSIL